MAVTALTSTASSAAADRQALVDQINSTRTSTGNALSGSTTKPADQADRFLKLLVAQMSHQDPLNPLDNAQVTSQMAQISTVEGIEKINANISSLVDQSGGLRAVDAAGLIGKSALIEGDAINLVSGSGRAALQLDTDAAKVQVQVVNSAGRVVRTLDMNNLAKGIQPIEWDGRDNNGQAMADGQYTLRAMANPGLSQTSVTTLTPTKINAVVGDKATLKLDLTGIGLRDQSDVKGFM